MSESTIPMRETEAFDLMELKLSSVNDSDESGIEEIIRKCDEIFNHIPKGAVVNGEEKKLIEAQLGLIQAICRAEKVYYNEKRKRREVEAELAKSRQEVLKMKAQLSALEKERDEAL